MTAAKILNDAVEHLAGYYVKRGWHLSGPGPARFGWGLYSPAGACTFLGQTAKSALNQLQPK